ncbi:NADPH-dependent FMN reductase [Azohydromonas caseinilytica]|uniref:NAD(P)H-dependent oxidoreductase n=1 Tax=Azohydromonas caseinilytica TaxID=2728836 RepID=A0A848F827_9BURK|nr:NAD(P)H-dependent oxidoreductase [Azohydromonas caseinilytica]NML14916.1 NAD(P)H-dependent oxidoreductase [Azohydromonas caseinilytica]
MDQRPKILAFAGSARQQSLNRKLVQVAAQGARQAGAEVTLIDLKDYPLPIYDGDIEAAGFPDNVRRLRELLLGHQGFLIASPEYNGSVSPLLKNVIDWCSRPVDGQDGLAPYRNKVVVLMSASPGGFGGLRALPHLRTVLSGIGAIVLPDQVAVPKAHEAFAPEGGMVNDKQRATIEALGVTLASTLSKLHGQPLLDQTPERRHDLSRIG